MWAKSGKYEVRNDMPTMKDVAKEAGVALGTVSKVINNIPVREEYRIRVEKAIEKLGYEVNHYARGMKLQKTNTVALIIPNLLTSFFAAFAYYLELALSEYDYKLLLCNSNGHPQKEIDYVNMARHNMVDGIVGITYSDIDQYVTRDIPFLSLDRHFSDTIPCIASDNYEGGRMAARKLAETGCKNVGYMYVRVHDQGETKKRKLGFCDEAQQVGLEWRTYQVNSFATEDFENGCREFIDMNIVDGTLIIDGIFFSTDLLALRAKFILESLGYSVPDQVQLIGYDGISAAEGGCLVSSIRQPVKEIAGTAASLILKLIDKGRVPELTCLPVEFIDGGTTK